MTPERRKEAHAAPEPAFEEVVLVDAKGRATGSAPKHAVHHRQTPLHLAFSCYLVDSAGRVLLTQRAPEKTTWPGVWTNSCCGHPLPGEAIVDAVARRLRDELGTSGEQVDLILPHFRYRAVMPNGTVENELCPVFRAVVGSGLRPNRREVAELRWDGWDDVVAMAATPGPAISPWFRAQVAVLAELGPDPRTWPVADPRELPPAAREPSARD